MAIIIVGGLIGISFDVLQDDDTTSKMTFLDAIRNQEEDTRKTQLILNSELNIVKINMKKF